jgi:hypothetical protein
MATSTKTRILVALLLLTLWSAQAQQLPLVPIYDYRVCQVEHEPDRWTTGVYRVNYDASGAFLSMSEEPVALELEGRQKAKRFKHELKLYAEAYEKPTLEFGLLYPREQR